MFQYHISEEDIRKFLTPEEQIQFRKMAFKIKQGKNEEIQKTIVRLSNDN